MFASTSLSELILSSYCKPNKILKPRAKADKTTTTIQNLNFTILCSFIQRPLYE